MLENVVFHAKHLAITLNSSSTLGLLILYCTYTALFLCLIPPYMDWHPQPLEHPSDLMSLCAAGHHSGKSDEINITKAVTAD